MARIYYLFNPNNNVFNKYWYKYLHIDHNYEDFIWSYKVHSYFESRLFTVYICNQYQKSEPVIYNVCKLDEDIYLYYYDDIVYIQTSKLCNNKILNILNNKSIIHFQKHV
jgi:hypothetical protein